jgi:ankyrin repeat protein
MVKLLLSIDKVEVDAMDRENWTRLSLAAANGHEAVVKLLLNTGKFDVEAKGLDGRTPLSLAAMNGHEAVVKLMHSFNGT